MAKHYVALTLEVFVPGDDDGNNQWAAQAAAEEVGRAFNTLFRNSGLYDLRTMVLERTEALAAERLLQYAAK